MSIIWAKVDSFAGNLTSPALACYRPCPICGSLRSRVVVGFDGFQFYTDSAEVPKRVDIRENQCLDCAGLYLNPCYSDLGFRVLFSEAGQSYGATQHRPHEQIKWLATRGLLRAGIRLLDAGCYDGRFLAQLPRDVEKVGVDIDGPAIERAWEQFGADGIEFVLGDFETFEYGHAPDVITMFHVLEHLPRPVVVLGNLRSIAHPATRLVVEVPILENGITNDINGFFSVQHMTHFSRRSLRNCLGRAGWRIVESYEQTDYNGCRLLAQPCEPTSAVVGDPQDGRLLHRYLSAWYQALVAVDQSLGDLANAERCVIWGGGVHTEFLYHTTSFFRVNADRDYVIVDSDPMKQGKTWRGIAIQNPSVLAEADWSRTWMLVSSYGSQEVIAGAAIALQVPVERILRLYDKVRVY